MQNLYLLTVIFHRARTLEKLVIDKHVISTQLIYRLYFLPVIVKHILLMILRTSEYLNAGVKIIYQPCCPTQAVGGSCIRGSTPCIVRGDYSFFDMHHPTEKSIFPGARRSWQALEPQDTYPMDISHLARL